MLSLEITELSEMPTNGHVSRGAERLVVLTSLTSVVTGTTAQSTPCLCFPYGHPSLRT
jgi:hypothetical protein